MNANLTRSINDPWPGDLSPINGNQSLMAHTGYNPHCCPPSPLHHYPSPSPSQPPLHLLHLPHPSDLPSHSVATSLRTPHLFVACLLYTVLPPPTPLPLPLTYLTPFLPSPCQGCRYRQQSGSVHCSGPQGPSSGPFQCCLSLWHSLDGSLPDQSHRS